MYGAHPFVSHPSRISTLSMSAYFPCQTLRLGFVFLLFSILSPCNASQETETLNITVPKGTSNHGDPHLLCTPTQWTDIAVFFIGNYVSHAATVKSVPGEPTASAFLALVLALVFPVSGVIRGVDSIWRRSIFAPTELEKALRAGALSMVVRSKTWKPQTGDEVRNMMLRRPPGQAENRTPPHGGNGTGTSNGDAQVSPAEHEERDVELGHAGRSDHRRDSIQLETISHLRCDEVSQSRPKIASGLKVSSSYFSPRYQPSDSLLSISGRRVHGICSLPEGYELQILPKSSVVSPTPDDGCQQASSPWPEVPKASNRTPHTSAIKLSSSHSFAKALIAILQTIFASATLYRTRGDQLSRFGYASFGLTVTPYLIMSILNLVSLLVSPDYPYIYLVHTDIMAEASRRKGARFVGVVGSVPAEEQKADENEANKDLFDASFEVEEGKYVLLRANAPGPTGERVDVNKAGDNNDPQLIVPTTNLKNCVDDTRFKVILCGSTIAPISAIIIVAISGFKPGLSTKAQRVWITGWIWVGIATGPLTHFLFLGLLENLFRVSARLRLKMILGAVVVLLLYSSPAIGGYVVVGQMIKSYGRCIRIY
ncbi:MAG: hypothetical protein M1840_002443 [Geoglossum simile]|nr:MAG: hypothetical protein M1840_002443 [Geoglossum simile]